MIIKKVFTIYKSLASLSVFESTTTFRLLTCNFVPVPGYETRLKDSKGIVFNASSISCLSQEKGLWLITVNASDMSLVKSDFFYLQYMENATWHDVDGMSPFYLKVTPWMQEVTINGGYGFDGDIGGKVPVVSGSVVDGTFVTIAFGNQFSDGTTAIPSYSIKKVSYSFDMADESQRAGSRESIDYSIDIPLKSGVKKISYTASVINPKNGTASASVTGELSIEKNMFDLLSASGAALPDGINPMDECQLSHYTSPNGLHYIELSLPSPATSVSGLKYAYEVSYRLFQEGLSPTDTLVALIANGTKISSPTNKILIPKPVSFSGDTFHMTAIYRITNSFTNSSWKGSSSTYMTFLNIKMFEWQVPNKIQLMTSQLLKKSSGVYPVAWDSDSVFSKTLAKTLTKMTYLEDYILKYTWGYPTSAADNSVLTDQISKVLIKAFYLSRPLTVDEQTAVQAGLLDVYDCVSSPNAIVREMQFYVERLPKRTKIDAVGTTFGSHDSNSATVDVKWNDRLVVSFAAITDKGISGLLLNKYIDVQKESEGNGTVADNFKEAVENNTSNIDALFTGIGLSTSSVSISEVHGMSRGSEVVTVVGGTSFKGRATWNLTYAFGGGQSRTITSQHGSFTLSKPLSSDSAVWSETEKTCALSLHLWLSSSESEEQTPPVEATYTVSANYLPVSEIITGLAASEAMQTAVAVKLGQLYSSNNSATNTPAE